MVNIYLIFCDSLLKLNLTWVNKLNLLRVVLENICVLRTGLFAERARQKAFLIIFDQNTYIKINNMSEKIVKVDNKTANGCKYNLIMMIN